MRTALWVILAACLATGMSWQTVEADPYSACEKGELSEDGMCEDEEEISYAPEAVGPEAVTPRGAFPAPSCRPGYFQQGPRLCMTGGQAATSFANAEVRCQDIRGRIADYADWRYRRLRGDGILAPVGWWLGPMTADNRALYVNQANSGDFDGEANRFDIRQFACAHDDNS